MANGVAIPTLPDRLNAQRLIGHRLASNLEFQRYDQLVSPYENDFRSESLSCFIIHLLPVRQLGTRSDLVGAFFEFDCELSQ